MIASTLCGKLLIRRPLPPPAVPGPGACSGSVAGDPAALCGRSGRAPPGASARVERIRHGVLPRLGPLDLVGPLALRRRSAPHAPVASCHRERVLPLLPGGEDDAGTERSSPRSG